MRARCSARTVLAPWVTAPLCGAASSDHVPTALCVVSAADQILSALKPGVCSTMNTSPRLPHSVIFLRHNLSFPGGKVGAPIPIRAPTPFPHALRSRPRNLKADPALSERGTLNVVDVRKHRLINVVLHPFAFPRPLLPAVARSFGRVCPPMMKRALGWLAAVIDHHSFLTRWS